jgi:cyclic pyranopterin phosphate synthase
VNVSLDTLDPGTFRAATRWGDLDKVLGGIFAAKAAGLHVKINAVAMRGVNEDEFDRMLAWCGEHGFDLCLIETMPLGETGEDRTEQYLPLSTVRAKLKQRWTLTSTTTSPAAPPATTTWPRPARASASSRR